MKINKGGHAGGHAGHGFRALGASLQVSAKLSREGSTLAGGHGGSRLLQNRRSDGHGGVTQEVTATPLPTGGEGLPSAATHPTRRSA